MQNEEKNQKKKEIPKKRQKQLHFDDTKVQSWTLIKKICEN